MPGSGKSTLGRAYAAATGRPFIDLDDLAEEIAGEPIAAMFARDPDEFRRAEAQALNEACRIPEAIVACGGGTPCHGDNMSRMLAAGNVVLLEAEMPRLIARLMEAPPGQRPMLDDVRDNPAALEERLRELAASREPFYSRARIICNSTELDTPEEIRESVRMFHNFLALL